jgi:hypothetical protein
MPLALQVMLNAPAVSRHLSVPWTEKIRWDTDKKTKFSGMPTGKTTGKRIEYNLTMPLL